MASDRFIYWDKTRPNMKKLDPVIRYFFGDGIGIKRIKHCWIIYLPGTPPNKGLPGHMTPANELYHKERFIEVWPGTRNVNVLTRRADPFVSALADGLVVFIKRALGGFTQDM